MAHTIAWEESVRPEVQALIDQLPAELRARYPTPESLAALAISRHALEVSAIHITATTPADDSHATLTVEGLTGADEKLPMLRGADGWQLLAGKPMLEVLRQQLGVKKICAPGCSGWRGFAIYFNNPVSSSAWPQTR